MLIKIHYVWKKHYNEINEVFFIENMGKFLFYLSILKFDNKLQITLYTAYEGKIIKDR